MRKNKRVVVYNETGFHDVPEKASEFMDFWQSKLDVIPHEFIDSAKIEVEGDFIYDCAVIEVSVSYVRPELDSELESRLKREEVFISKNKKRKLEQYNRLKKELNL